MKILPSKRGPWFDIVVFAIIVFCTIITLLIVLSNDKIDFQKTLDTLTNSDSVTKKSSMYPGVQIVSDISNDSNNPYAIHYPQTDNEVFNNAIHTYIAGAKKNYIEKTKNTNKTLTNELNIKFETSVFHDNYYSFVFTKKLKLGQHEPSITTKTFLYNKASKKLLSLPDVLNKDQNNLNTLSKHIQSELKQLTKLKGLLIQEKFQMATKPQWNNFQKFSIEGDMLFFYFDKNEIANEKAESIILPISLSFLNPILATDFQKEMVNVKTILSKPKSNHTNVKRVALTFDDGPHPEVTPRILKILDKYHAKATFFMLGNRVQYYPEIAQETLANGHEIGNHTWGHPLLTNLGAEQILLEYNKTNQIIFNTIGEYPTVFRPPYGATNDFVEQQLPLDSTLWTIDTLDWKHRNAQRLINVTKSTMHNNAIILMHDIHSSTADALNTLLNDLQKQGYEFVTVSELTNH